MAYCMDEQEVLDFFLITHSSLSSILSKEFFKTSTDHISVWGANYFFFSPKGVCRLQQYFMRPKPYYAWFIRMMEHKLSYEEISNRTGLCKGFIAGYINIVLKKSIDKELFEYYNVEAILDPIRYSRKKKSVNDAKAYVQRIREFYGTNTIQNELPRVGNF